MAVVSGAGGSDRALRGEMAARVAGYDWSRTPLGRPRKLVAEPQADRRDDPRLAIPDGGALGTGLRPHLQRRLPADARREASARARHSVPRRLAGIAGAVRADAPRHAGGRTRRVLRRRYRAAHHPPRRRAGGYVLHAELQPGAGRHRPVGCRRRADDRGRDHPARLGRARIARARSRARARAGDRAGRRRRGFPHRRFPQPALARIPDHPRIAARGRQRDARGLGAAHPSGGSRAGRAAIHRGGARRRARIPRRISHRPPERRAGALDPGEIRDRARRRRQAAASRRRAYRHHRAQAHRAGAANPQ